MLFDRAQHVGETAGHIGADRLALERAGAGAPDIALGDRNAEMIRPERDQPLDENRSARRRRGLRRAAASARKICCSVGGCGFIAAGGGAWRGDGRSDVIAGGDASAATAFDQRGDIGRGHAEARKIFLRRALALQFFAILILVDRLQRLRRALQSRVVDEGAARRIEFGENSFARVGHSGQDRPGEGQGRIG